MDQGGRLERMAGGFARHLLRGEPTQFFVDDGKKFGGGFGIAGMSPLQDMAKAAQLLWIAVGDV